MLESLLQSTGKERVPGGCVFQGFVFFSLLLNTDQQKEPGWARKGAVVPCTLSKAASG